MGIKWEFYIALPKYKKAELTISDMNGKCGEFTVYSHDLHESETFIRYRERSSLLPEHSF